MRASSQISSNAYTGSILGCLILKMLLFATLGHSALAIISGESRHHRSPPVLNKRAAILPSADEALSSRISLRQFYQARFNFGVNFGSSFVREDWIFPSLFPGGATTELELATIASKGSLANEKRAMEAFWSSFVKDDDWDWLQKNGVNSVRVPLGYWNIDGGRFTKGTRFEPFAKLYENSWKIFKSVYIEPAAKRGISILVDIHGVPGGANVDDHNGEKSSSADFWTTPAYQDLMVQALSFVAQDLKQYDNISGIQVINESEYADPATAQKAFYARAISAIRKVDSAVPVVISDGWSPETWTQWVQQSQDPNSPAGVVVDHHFYKCFSTKDTSRSAEQLIGALSAEMLPSVKANGEGVDFMVGEWANVFGEQSWTVSGIPKGSSKRGDLEAKYGGEVERLIEERATTGSYFWTYKFESGNGGGWDFRQQLGRSFSAPKLSVPEAADLDKVRDTLAVQLKSSAAQEGFKSAWNDAALFARLGSLIGRKQAVMQARRSQYLKAGGNLASINDWKTGFEQGLVELEKRVRVQ